MKKTKLIAAVATVALLLGACTMQKRQYMAGYHIEWKNGKNDVAVKHTNSDKNLKNDIKPVVFAEAVVNEIPTREIAPINATEVAGDQTNYSLLTESKSVASYTKKSVVNNSKREKITLKEKVAVIKQAKKAAKNSSEPAKGLYIVLAIFIPFVAVGLATDWGIEVLWNILWCLLCGIPGIIHAFVILKRKGLI